MDDERRYGLEEMALAETSDPALPQTPVTQGSREPISPRLGIDGFFRNAVRHSQRHLLSRSSALPSELRSLLIPQSIVGHGQQGHVGFEGVRYPNTTTEDVLEALGTSFKRFWGERQRYIDDIRVWLDRAVRDPSDPRVRMPVNQNDHPLGGCMLVEDFASSQEVIDVLAGFVYGSRMDTYDPWRLQVRALFGKDMGGGITAPIDMDRLNSYGLTLVDLASAEHTDEDVASLIARGILINESTVASRAVTNGYVRRKKGLGVSDDAALITAGFFRGAPGYLGAMLADHVDSIDKSAMEIRVGGQDEELGKFVARECARNGIDLGLDDRLTSTWIALAAIDAAQPTQWLHCSQRYFYEYAPVDGKGKLKNRIKHYPAELHLRFALAARAAGSFERAREIANGIPSILTSFTRRSNRELYRAYLDRLEDFQERGHIVGY